MIPPVEMEVVGSGKLWYCQDGFCWWFCWWFSQFRTDSFSENNPHLCIRQRLSNIAITAENTNIAIIEDISIPPKDLSSSPNWFRLLDIGFKKRKKSLKREFIGTLFLIVTHLAVF